MDGRAASRLTSALIECITLLKLLATQKKGDTYYNNIKCPFSFMCEYICRWSGSVLPTCRPLLNKEAISSQSSLCYFALQDLTGFNSCFPSGTGQAHSADHNLEA